MYLMLKLMPFYLQNSEKLLLRNNSSEIVSSLLYLILTRSLWGILLSMQKEHRGSQSWNTCLRPPSESMSLECSWKSFPPDCNFTWLVVDMTFRSGQLHTVVSPLSQGFWRHHDTTPCTRLLDLSSRHPEKPPCKCRGENSTSSSVCLVGLTQEHFVHNILIWTMKACVTETIICTLSGGL